MNYHCYVFSHSRRLADVVEIAAEYDVEACVRAEELAIAADEHGLHQFELWQGDRRIYSL